MDNFKKGNDTINFEAREFIRLIDNLSRGNKLQDWIPLNGKGKGKFKVLMSSPVKKSLNAEEIFDEKKAEEIGIKAFVLKPLVEQKLAESIRAVLDAV